MVAIGIDISKKKIDFFYQGRSASIPNEKKSIEKYFQTFLSCEDVKIVMEATGRYHRLSHKVLSDMGLPVMVINPFQSRHFAKSMNVICKTDKVDAKILSQYAERMDFKQTKLLSGNEQELKDLIRHLQDLKTFLNQSELRLSEADGFSLQSLNRLIQQLKIEIKLTEKAIAKLISSDDDLAMRRKLLLSIPGIGNLTASALLGLLPELGSLSNRTVASLAGVAPMNFDSGFYKGKRRIQKGRHDIRSLLYMPNLGASTRHNPTLKGIYNRLIAIGKPSKVALIACMRKLLIFANATLKQKSPWQAKELGVA